MCVQDRIQQIIEYTGLNKNSFSNKIGVQPQTLHHIISGRRTKPSFDILEKIASTFSDINLSWLLTGKGDMMQTNVSKQMSGENVDKMSDINKELIIDEKKQNDSVVDPEYLTRKKKIQQQFEYEWHDVNFLSGSEIDFMSKSIHLNYLYEKKQIERLYLLPTRELNNRIAILKSEHKSLYNDYYKLCEAISNFDTGPYADKFEMPISLAERVVQIDSEIKEDYLELDSKKLKTIFYILGYEGEIEGIRHDIHITIIKFNEASRYNNKFRQ